MDWAAPPCRSMSTYDKRDLCLDPLWTFGPSLDNCPGYIIAARGGPYASLLDGIKMTTYVCNTLCAVYNIPTTQEKSIFFGAYMVFLWFHNHCKLALLGPEAQRSICEICPTNLAGFLGFHMDLLVQDSIWIYLFSLWPYGPTRSLWWWNLCSEGDTTLHCLSLW